MNSLLNKDNKNKDWTLLQIVQWYESNSLDCMVELIGSNFKKSTLETLRSRCIVRMRFVPWARSLWSFKTRRGLSGGKSCHGSSLRRLRDSNQNRRDGL